MAFVRYKLYSYGVLDSYRPDILKHTVPPGNPLPYIIPTMHRTIIPHHQRTISHAVVFPHSMPGIQQTVPTYDIAYRATAHTMPHRTVTIPYHTYTVPTPPEGSNIWGHKKNMSHEESSRARTIVDTLLLYQHHKYACKEQEAWRRAFWTREGLLKLNITTDVCLALLVCGCSTQIRVMLLNRGTREEHAQYPCRSY